MSRSRLCIAGLMFLSWDGVIRAEPDKITAAATSSQTVGPDRLVDDRGLTKTDRRLALTDNADAEGGCMWTSGYTDRGADEHPLVQFDLGRQVGVGGFRVWNMNEKGYTFRGFRDVTVQLSDDGTTWRTVPQRFRFAQAPGKPGYLGEEYWLSKPVVTRYVRFLADSTWRSGGNRELAGLGKVRFLPAAVPLGSEQPWTTLFPPDACVVNVKDAPYNARGDGIADDTDALQRAITDHQGTMRIIYLPKGTYSVSRSLRYRCGVGYGHTRLRGESQRTTVVRLKDGTFTDPAKPRAVIFTGFNGPEEGGRVSADWFHNMVTDLTIDTGKNNPGAIGIQFYSNNTGRLGNVTVTSGDDGGVIGVDLGYADQNGPLLVQNVSVNGFQIGIRTAGSVNSQTFRSIVLENQTKVGLQNDGQCLSIAGLKTTGTVPALRSRFGLVALVDGEFVNTDPAARESAVTSKEAIYARGLKASGFLRAVGGETPPGAGTDGPEAGEFVAPKPAELGGDAEVFRDFAEPGIQFAKPSGWANVRNYRQVSDPDDTAAFQRAIDSGRETVYFPLGAPFILSGPVIVRGSTRRIAGMGSRVEAAPLKGTEKPVIRVTDAAGASSVRERLFISDLRSDVPIEFTGRRSVTVRDSEVSGSGLKATGRLQVENVVGTWSFGRQTVTAVQFNVENEGTHVINDGGRLAVLGLKTERGGTLIETKNGGTTDLVGGLCYTTTAGKLAPMFVIDQGHLSATIGEVCYNGDPYTVLVREVLGTHVRTVKRGELPLRPNFLQGSLIPRYVSR